MAIIRIPGFARNHSNLSDLIKALNFECVNTRKEFFMQLRDYIEEGVAKTGSITGLAAHLGVTANSLTDAKRNQRGLPNHAVYKLAKLTGHTTDSVMAASELTTEKKESNRKFWNSVISHARAAAILGAVGLVTNFVTPSPAQAAPVLSTTEYTICIMLSRTLKQIISPKRAVAR